jgi:hypothetical protein
MMRADSGQRAQTAVAHPPLRLFRMSLYLFASALAAFSLWTLLPEFARSSIRQLPTSPAAAELAVSARARAYRAARLGGIRGDLWAESSFTYVSPLWRSEREAAALADEARAVIETALAHAPHDARVWLLAASLGARLRWPHVDPASVLKMSYYTGPNEIGLIPPRLLAAAQLGASDSDVQQLLERDVRLVLKRRPELRPALVAAYKDAKPQVKQLLESAVVENDPAFLPTLRGKNP